MPETIAMSREVIEAAIDGLRASLSKTEGQILVLQRALPNPPTIGQHVLDVTAKHKARIDSTASLGNGKRRGRPPLTPAERKTQSRRMKAWWKVKKAAEAKASSKKAAAAKKRAK
jgi:hypothetical protein